MFSTAVVVAAVVDGFIGEFWLFAIPPRAVMAGIGPDPVH